METEMLDCQIQNEASAKPATDHHRTPPVFRRRLRGKVARLPFHARNIVNQALRDGARYAEAAGLLAAHGFHGFKISDILAWTRRGYRLWLEQQERFEQSRPPSSRAVALAGSLRQDGRSDLADLNESILSAQLNDLLEAMDESALKQLLADKPEDYFRLARAVTSFTAARAQHQQAELERLKYELEIRKIQERQANRLAPPQITPEIQARIDAAAKLL